jgi:hypothetical protein
MDVKNNYSYLELDPRGCRDNAHDAKLTFDNSHQAVLRFGANVWYKYGRNPLPVMFSRGWNFSWLQAY